MYFPPLTTTIIITTLTTVLLQLLLLLVETETSAASYSFSGPLLGTFVMVFSFVGYNSDVGLVEHRWG